MIATAVGLCLLLVSYGLLWLYSPNGAGPLAAAIVDAFTGRHHPPAIAEGQIGPEEWRNFTQGSEKVTAVLQRRFPVGRGPDRLLTGLADEGFKLDATAAGRPSSANYDWGSVICRQYLRVEWETDAEDHVTRILGRYGWACL